MRAGLAVASLAVALALPAGASSPVERWKSGDWWEVQMEHPTFHHGSPIVAWTPSFRLRFEVTRSNSEVRVEVSTIPENRFRERLVLRYKPTGEMISSEIVDPERVEPLGPVGGFGAFGALGVEAFDLSRVPPRPVGSRLPLRAPMTPGGGAVQVWGPDDPWWTQYEIVDDLPTRVGLVDASWRDPRIRHDRLTPAPGGPGLGPEAPAYGFGVPGVAIAPAPDSAPGIGPIDGGAPDFEGAPIFEGAPVPDGRPAEEDDAVAEDAPATGGAPRVEETPMDEEDADAQEGSPEDGDVFIDSDSKEGEDPAVEESLKGD